MARPSKYTPEVHRQIVAALEEGLTRGAASRIAGITDRTMRTWMADESGEFDQFQADVERAESEVERSVTKALLDNARDGDTKAQQFYLERRVPEYRQRSEQKVDATVGSVSLDDLQRLRETAEANRCDPSSESEPSS